MYLHKTTHVLNGILPVTVAETRTVWRDDGGQFVHESYVMGLGWVVSTALRATP